MMKALFNLLIAQQRNLQQCHEDMAKHYSDISHALEGLLTTGHVLNESVTLEGPDILPAELEAQLLQRIRSGRQDSGSPEPAEMEKIRELLPRHVSVAFITDYLEISPSTFYRQIDKNLLERVCEIGNSPYYLLADLIRLMQHKDYIPHEKGAWTFAKMNRKKQGTVLPDQKKLAGNRTLFGGR